MTGLQSACRAQCTYRHSPSLVLEGKYCFLLVATGSGLISMQTRGHVISLLLVLNSSRSQPGSVNGRVTFRIIINRKPWDRREPSLGCGALWAHAGPAERQGHFAGCTGHEEIRIMDPPFLGVFKDQVRWGFDHRGLCGRCPCPWQEDWN